MAVSIHNHNGGEKIISIKIFEEMLSSVDNLKSPFVRGGTPQIRSEILDRLSKYGWSSQVLIDSGSKISITGMLGDVALCVQTGNMSRFYADLLKLQYLYKKNRVKSAFYVIYTNTAAKQVGDNVANFERFVAELIMFKEIVTIPMVVIGFEK